MLKKTSDFKDKIKNLFFNNINDNEEKIEDTSDTFNSLLLDNEISFEIIHINPNIYLAHRGARICIGQGPISGSFRDKACYVSKVLARQHESILEHTNIIVLMYIKKSVINNNLGDFTEFLSSLKFCNMCTVTDNDNVIILVGGSIRAYIHALRETRKSNCFLTSWSTIMYSTIEKEFLVNCFKDEMLYEENCNYITDSESFNNELETYDVAKVNIPKEEEYGDTVTLIYKNNILAIYEKVKQYFTIKDVAKVCTISFIFHDVSRSCSHQLVRHRNGISQESQRYVTKKYNYEEDFVDPIKLETDRYKDNESIKDLDFSTGTFENYNTLIEIGVHKEDARAWLPTNVKTKLMMTFTYWNFCKFLQLRMDKHAQKEIRNLACCAASVISKDIEDINNIIHFSKDNQDILMDFINYINSYKYLVEETDLTDESFNSIDEEINSLDIDTEDKAEKILAKSDKLKML